MPAALPLAIRRAIQAELALGHSARAVARRFGCSPMTIVRFRRQAEEAQKTSPEGHLGPAAGGIRRPRNGPSAPF